LWLAARLDMAIGSSQSRACTEVVQRVDAFLLAIFPRQPRLSREKPAAGSTMEAPRSHHHRRQRHPAFSVQEHIEWCIVIFWRACLAVPSPGEFVMRGIQAFALWSTFVLCGFGQEIESEPTDKAVENIKSIGAGLHALHNAHKAFPPSASYDEAGQPLLSWRVHLLPFIGCQKLFAEFHLNEPWDSDHNKKLVAKMPEVYKNPRIAGVKMGHTTFLAPVGPGAAFEGRNGISLQEVHDGTYNTILLVEVASENAVIWTKPAEYQVDFSKPSEGLHFDAEKLSMTLFVCGEVYWIPKSIPAINLCDYFDRTDGHVTAGLVDRQR
jgi:hypothetical protein